VPESRRSLSGGGPSDVDAGRIVQAHVANHVGPPGSAQVGLAEVVREGLDHGDEAMTGGHERSEYALVDQPFGAQQVL